MYFKRYFSGTLPNLTDKENRALYEGVSGTVSTSICKNQTDTLGSAIAQTLKEVGLDAGWDSEHCVVWLDQTTKQRGFEILFISAYPKQWRCRSLHSGITSGYLSFTVTASSSNYLFGSTTYGFYITLKGEPQRGFILYVGSDSVPSYENGSIGIIYGVDKRTNENILLLAATNSLALGGATYYPTKGTNHVCPRPNTPTNTMILTVNTNSKSNDPTIACLYPARFSYCFVVPVDGVYGSIDNLTTVGFYTIDGVEYFSSGIFVKCTTPPPV